MLFKVNDKEYKAQDITYNFICDLMESGVDVERLNNISFVRHYFALCAGISASDAGREIECHIINYGKFPQELVDAFNEKSNESAFFRAVFGMEDKNSEEGASAEAPEVPQKPQKRTSKKEQ